MKPSRNVTKKEVVTAAKNDAINFLNARFSILARVGEAVEKNLTRLVLRNRIFDLLLHRPLRVEKILLNPRLSDVLNGELIAIKAKIEAHTKPPTRRQPYKILCFTPGGYLQLIFFKTFPGQMEKLPIGREVAILGHLQRSLIENQITHPLKIIEANKIDELPKENVVYPLVAGVSNELVRKKIADIVGTILGLSLPECINEKILRSHNWPSLPAALQILHSPKTDADLSPQNLARQRLAYDEILAWQLALALVKQAEDSTKKLPKLKKNFADEFLRNMPFKPTDGQLQAATEIKKDMLSNKKMLRLLQGDVGSGKTVLAIYACLLSLAQGKQSCVIVPISILAQQHFDYFTRMTGDLSLQIGLLTSKTTKKQRAQMLQDLAQGKIHILISTHAVLQDDVKFKNLGLAVIDEQHRFGVMQRLKLVEKGAEVDVLLMSATPIPRSLMMAMYADMDISILAEKPKGRKEIKTLVMSQNRSEEVVAAVKRALKEGEKIYWICPAIEDEQEEEKYLVAAEEKFQTLQKIFGDSTVALIHGKMKNDQKEKVMENFAGAQQVGAAQILVATTVIEVGVDVRDATIIIIENAENFGLSQLHQLRGRVGRGDKQSYCILLYGKRYGEKGKQRLGILRQSNDGFFIAEEDLKMRGSGELLGTRQSGVPEFKIADLNFDAELLKLAHKNSAEILCADPQLQTSESKKYRDLLKLFDYDDCLRILGGG